jgi:hypothetical protein
VDLVYKALVCRFAENSCSFDVVEDVLEPLLQALLKAQNEYGWAGNSCAPGSISFVVAVLEGRLELKAEAAPLKLTRAGKVDRFAELAAYAKNLERAMHEPTLQYLEAIRAEAVRCRDVRGLPERQAFEEILNVIAAEPDAFDYAMNELRGIFFSELMVKHDELLKERFHSTMNSEQRYRVSYSLTLLSHRPMTAGYREPEYVSENMNALLSLLHRVADVFARSFLLVVEDIPRVFGMVLKP